MDLPRVANATAMSRAKVQAETTWIVNHKKRVPSVSTTTQCDAAKREAITGPVGRRSSGHKVSQIPRHLATARYLSSPIFGQVTTGNGDRGLISEFRVLVVASGHSSVLLERILEECCV
jgi:hypothetical protein